MPPNILSLQHVYVSRGGPPVLHDINLEVAAGQHLAILGPNGCGKSTLLKTITCELYPLAHAPGGQPTSISIFGRTRWDLTLLRQRLGVVSAELPGKPTLQTTGFDTILTGFFSASTLWPNLTITEPMRARAEDLLRQVGAEALRHKLVGQMSAGEQRRIMIARALAGSRLAAHQTHASLHAPPASEPARSITAIDPHPTSAPTAFATSSTAHSAQTVPPTAATDTGAQTPAASLASNSSAPPPGATFDFDRSPDLPTPDPLPPDPLPPGPLPPDPHTPDLSGTSGDMLLLDEPSNALDIAAQSDLRSLLRELAQQGTAILLITHHTADIIPEIDRVLLMSQGRIAADGPKQNLLTAPTLSNLFGREITITEREGFFHTW